jgi:hypothetical protein
MDRRLLLIKKIAQFITKLRSIEHLSHDRLRELTVFVINGNLIY